MFLRLLPRTRSWLLIIERPQKIFYSPPFVLVIFSYTFRYRDKTELKSDEILLLWLFTVVSAVLLGPERRKTFIIPVLVLIVLLDLQFLFNWLLVGKLNESLLHVPLLCCSSTASSGTSDGIVVHLHILITMLPAWERTNGSKWQSSSWSDKVAVYSEYT